MGNIFQYKCINCKNSCSVESDIRGRVKRVVRDENYDDPSTPSSMYKCNYCDSELVPTMPKDLYKDNNGEMPKVISQIRITKENISMEPENVQMLVSLSALYVVSGGYLDATKTLDKAKEIDAYVPEIYYLQAIARLGGKAPRLSKETDVKLALENCDTAIGFEEDIDKAAIYKMLKAYIQYDYYESRGRIMIPSYRKLLQEVKLSSAQYGDIDALFKMLKVTKPSTLN